MFILHIFIGGLIFSNNPHIKQFISVSNSFLFDTFSVQENESDRSFDLAKIKNKKMTLLFAFFIFQ